MDINNANNNGPDQNNPGAGGAGIGGGNAGIGDQNNIGGGPGIGGDNAGIGGGGAAFGANFGMGGNAPPFAGMAGFGGMLESLVTILMVSVNSPLESVPTLDLDMVDSITALEELVDRVLYMLEVVWAFNPTLESWVVTINF